MSKMILRLTAGFVADGAQVKEFRFGEVASAIEVPVERESGSAGAGAERQGQFLLVDAACGDVG